MQCLNLLQAILQNDLGMLAQAVTSVLVRLLLLASTVAHCTTIAQPVMKAHIQCRIKCANYLLARDAEGFVWRCAHS
jgi:hypothetical protein